MAELSTFIKLDRNILDWRWYQDGNTFRVFIHLILKANIKDKDYRMITVHRGERVTSYAALASELGLSIKNIRTAIDHLKETGEVAVKSYSKFSVISIKNYDLYQSSGRQSADNRQANGSQTTTIDDIESENPEKVAGKWQAENTEIPTENGSLYSLDGSQMASNRQSNGSQVATIKEDKTSLCLSQSVLPEERRTDRPQPNEYLIDLQSQLAEMSGYQFLKEDAFKTFVADMIPRMAELLSNQQDALEKILEINQNDCSLIPFMNKLKKRCDEALSKLKYPQARNKFLQTTIKNAIMEYQIDCPESESPPEESKSAKQLSPKNRDKIPFGEILRQMNPDNPYCDDEEFQTEKDFSGFDDDDREVKNCRIPYNFQNDMNVMTDALKYLFCYSYNSENEEYRDFSGTVITCLSEAVCTGMMSFSRPVNPDRMIDRLNEINSSREDSLIQWMQAFLIHYRDKTEEKLAAGEKIKNSYGFLKTLAVNYLLNDYKSREVPGFRC